MSLSGLTVAHFWVALVLLGVGWNFAFIGATAMVTDCHTPAERAKVQGLNDFTIFGTTTIGSLLAGFLLAVVGWDTINGALIPVALAGAAAAAVLMPSIAGASPRPRPDRRSDKRLFPHWKVDFGDWRCRAALLSPARRNGRKRV